MTTTADESINFQDSLRFFRQQSETPAETFAPEQACSRISIPTVDSILESVRVLRAIQKSQKENVDHGKCCGVQELLLKANCVLGPPREDSTTEDFLDNSNENSKLRPKNFVDNQEVSCCRENNNKENDFSCSNLKRVSNSRKNHPLPNQVECVISKDTSNNDLPKSSGLHIATKSNKVNSLSTDHYTNLAQNKKPSPTDDPITKICTKNAAASTSKLNDSESTSLLKGMDSASEEHTESSSGVSSRFLKEENITPDEFRKDEEGRASRRFTTSSWDLVSIVKLLFSVEELQWPKVGLPESEDHSEMCHDLLHFPLKSHQNVVVIDLGSCSTRAGILMDQPTLPALFFPSVCATHKITGRHVYGLEALEERRNAIISFPLRPSPKVIEHSVDIDQVAGIFKKIFRDLRVDSAADYAVLVCLPRSLSISVQRDIVSLLLEDMKVKAVSLSHQAILTMYAHDVSTGIVLDIGDRMDVLPVVDGFVVEGGVSRLPHGGRRLIHHMKHALAQKHISLSNDIDSFVVEYISEKLSYVAEDYEKEASLLPQTLTKTVDLTPFARDATCPKCAALDDARFKVPEGLFKPDLWGLDSPGVHRLVQKAIQASGVDVRKKVAENIYVSGGLTLIPGFVERLAEEVTRLNKPRITPKVHASSHRQHCTFIGGCRVASMEAFSQLCLTREDYSKDTRLKKFALCV